MVDITSVLTRRESLSKAYYIKADTQEQHRLEIILMRERWKLIQSGVSRTNIKIRNSNIYVRTNYRPISLLCCTSYLTKLLVLTNQISIFQFGVLRHNSSLHQLLMFLGEIIIHLKTKLWCNLLGIQKGSRQCPTQGTATQVEVNGNTG